MATPIYNSLAQLAGIGRPEWRQKMRDEKDDWHEDRRAYIESREAFLGSLSKSNGIETRWMARSRERKTFWEQVTSIEPVGKDQKTIFWRRLRPVLERLHRNGVSPSQHDFERAIKSTETARRKARAAVHSIGTAVKYLETIGSRSHNRCRAI